MSERKRQVLDLNLLVIAVAIHETGSVSKSAIRLGMSQPAVSAALSKLRDYFDDQLFVRTSRGMAPTPRGADLSDVAREMMRIVEEKLKPEAVFESSKAQKPFTFALSDVGEIVFLPRLIQACQLASPNAPVRSVTLRPHDLSTALESGEVDLAVGYFPDLNENFFQQRLMTHRFLCLLQS